MIGQWRVEVTAPTPGKDVLFLHVIQLGDRTLTKMLPTELIQREGETGVRLVIGEDRWEIRFATQGDLAGHIRLAGGERLDRPLAQDVLKQVGVTR
jgi:hypothetical protein